MSYDLLIKGGRTYDGSGLPSFIGDVAVSDGQVVEIGRISASAKRTIDAAENRLFESRKRDASSGQISRIRRRLAHAAWGWVARMNHRATPENDGASF